MNKPSDPQRLAFDHQLKKRFVRGRPFTVAVAAAEELETRFKLPIWEAWEVVAGTLHKHGQEPTLDEVQSCIDRARSLRQAPTPREHQLGGTHLYLVLQAFGRWSMGLAGDLLRLMAPVDVREALALSPHPREELALASALVAALAPLARLGTGAQFTLADSRAIHAIALRRQPESSARAAGRRLLEDVVPEMERLLAGDLVFPLGISIGQGLRNNFAALHATAVCSLAHALKQSNEGDRVENLRRSVALYEHCCSLPQHQAETENFPYSLDHLATVRRELANELADLTERGQLLRVSIEAVDRGLEIVDQHPGRYLMIREPLRLNRAITEVHWLQHQEAIGALSAAEAQGALQRHAEATLAALRRSWIRYNEGKAAIPFFAQFAGQTEVAESSAAEALLGLTAQLAPHLAREAQRHMTRDEARRTLEAMAVLTPGGVPSSRVLGDTEVISCLRIIMGALHPYHAGIDTARELYAIQIAWMRPTLRRFREWGKKYIDDVFAGMHRWMHDQDLPGSYRRVFAAQISALARLALDPEHGLENVTPLERVRLHDLTGSAFYRAESTFYGQGPAHDAPAGTEPAWRIGLYRARHELDACATLVTCEELAARVDATLKPRIEAALAELRKVQEPASDGTNAAEELRRLRGEISERCRVACRWSPGFAQMTPVPSTSDIDAWLCSYRHIAVLLADGRELALAHGSSGEVSLENLVAFAGADWEPMMDLAGKLHDAWAALAMGPAGEESRRHADLRGALHSVLDSGPWRSFAAKLFAFLARRRVKVLALVERGVWRTFPWEGLVASRSVRLGSKVAIVHLPTLASTGAALGQYREGTLAYVAAPGHAGSAALDFGRAAFAASGNPVQEALGRDDFEHACTRVGAVRLFTHATYNTVDALLPDLVLGKTREDEPYHGHEILNMSLGGCRRVELWACESGVEMDVLGAILGNDEPLGIASCFLLAGAHVVIDSIWKQPAIVAAMIAAAFAAQARLPGSAGTDARALARALAAYRKVVAEEGIFETTLRAALRDALTQPNPRPDPIPHAFHTAWCAAVSHLTRKASVDLPWSAVEPFQANDSLLSEARTLTGDPAALDHDLHRVARRLTDELRADSATAWRVLARERVML